MNSPWPPRDALPLALCWIISQPWTDDDGWHCTITTNPSRGRR